SSRLSLSFPTRRSSDLVILGTKLKAPSPEALLWLYLASAQEQNFLDGINLLRSNPGLDLRLLRKQLERDQPELISRLEKMLSTRSEEHTSELQSLAYLV